MQFYTLTQNPHQNLIQSNSGSQTRFLPPTSFGAAYFIVNDWVKMEIIADAKLNCTSNESVGVLQTTDD